MWFAPITLAIVLLMLVSHGRFPAIAWPLLYLWLVSPIVGWWLSRPIMPTPMRLSEGQRVFLEKLARRTWRYFEMFVTEQENWLPPDNFQEHPVPVIAPRTSPTNIGMALLANLAAYDFGYCSVARLVDRTQKTFETLGRMERYRGHFYNWYDTRSLKPLLPMYVSMVDSGNLAGHLLVLRQGFLEMSATSILPKRMFGGLRDTVRVLLDAARGLHQTGAANPRPIVTMEVLHKIERIESDLDHPPATLRRRWRCCPDSRVRRRRSFHSLGGMAPTPHHTRFLHRPHLSLRPVLRSSTLPSALRLRLEERLRPERERAGVRILFEPAKKPSP